MQVDLDRVCCSVCNGPKDHASHAWPVGHLRVQLARYTRSEQEGKVDRFFPTAVLDPIRSSSDLLSAAMNA